MNGIVEQSAMCVRVSNMQDAARVLTHLQVAVSEDDEGEPTGLRAVTWLNASRNLPVCVGVKADEGVDLDDDLVIEALSDVAEAFGLTMVDTYSEPKRVRESYSKTIADRRAEALGLLDEVRALIDAVPADGTWAHAGDLGHLVETLRVAAGRE